MEACFRIFRNKICFYTCAVRNKIELENVSKNNASVLTLIVKVVFKVFCYAQILTSKMVRLNYESKIEIILS